LLSAADLVSLKKANSHFSDDLLSSLLNEPIPGQGVFWSSVGGKPYPVSLRVLSFEQMYSMADPAYKKPRAATYALELRKLFGSAAPAAQAAAAQPSFALEPTEADAADEQPVDVLAQIETRAIAALRGDGDLMGRVRSDMGAAWGSLKAFLLKQLPNELDDRDTIAYHLVRKGMDEIIGPQNQAWESYKNPQRGNKTYVRLKR